MLVVIRGAGDIATGIALRLWRAQLRVVMTETEWPTAIRRTVCFSEAVVRGEARERRPFGSRTCCTTLRPPAGFSWRWTPPTPRDCWRS